MGDQELVDLVMGKNRMYGDAEAEAASGVPLPSLRVLQGTGAIKSEKVAKPHGGFRRMWVEGEVLKAAIGAALGEHFAWNIRLVAAALAKHSSFGFWDQIAMLSFAVADRQEPMVREDRIMVSEDNDYYVDLFDRKFLFLRTPEALLPLPGFQVRNILLGMVDKDQFRNLSAAILSPEGQKRAIEEFGAEKAESIIKYHKMVMSAHKNFVSKTSVNISMPVRAAWRRMHGLEVKFIQEIFDQQGDSST